MAEFFGKILYRKYDGYKYLLARYNYHDGVVSIRSYASMLYCIVHEGKELIISTKILNIFLAARLRKSYHP